MKSKPVPYKPKSPSVFLAGLGLFVIGIIFGGWQLWVQQSNSIENFFSDKAWMYLEVDFQSAIFGGDRLDFSEEAIVAGLKLLTPYEVLPEGGPPISDWVGKKFGLALFEDQHFVLAAQYRNKSLAQKFIQNFVLPGDTLQEQESPYGVLYTPGFSSQMAFVFYKGWLLWSDSRYTLIEALGDDHKLAHMPDYKSVQKDLPTKRVASIFVNFNHWQADDALRSNWVSVTPLTRALGEIVPVMGGTLSLQNQKLKLDTKFLVHEGVYQDDLVSKPANKTIPDLAYLSPKGIMFFINGNDLYAKYLHTKNFLKDLDPQLEVVFQGIFRAQAKQIFGESFDFEKDLLPHFRGIYAFLLDFETALNFAFISRIDNTQAGADEALKSAIFAAQSRFVPKVETVELPDGTTREELVAVDPKEVPIEKKQIENMEYFVTKDPQGVDSFAYSIEEPYFIFSNQARLLERVIEAHKKVGLNLSQNIDFRNSVLFDFNASESYGFLNFPKLWQMLDYVNQLELSETTNEENSLTDFLNNGFWRNTLRNVTFSRMTYPGEVFMKAIFFLN